MSTEDKVQVYISALTTSQISGGAYDLILKEVNGSRRIQIIIGAFEAQSIALEMEGIKPPRPLTHDLMKNIVEALDGEVVDVTINELKDGTFYAKINFEAQEVDSRPSDAIALAVRFNAPIFVSEKVMEEAAIISEHEQQAKSSQATDNINAPKQSLSKLELLQKQLDDAIEQENYEKAAILRDEIKKLQSSH